MGKTKKTLREEQLESIIRNTLWMARRYADGRSTYAVSQYNSAARLAKELEILDIPPDKTWWAEDRMGKSFSGLTDAEWKELQKVKKKNYERS